jgi:hypothetical protein
MGTVHTNCYTVDIFSIPPPPHLHGCTHFTHGDTLPYYPPPPPLTIWQASTLYFSNNYLLPLIPDFSREEEERKGRKKDQGRPEGAQKKRR